MSLLTLVVSIAHWYLHLHVVLSRISVSCLQSFDLADAAGYQLLTFFIKRQMNKTHMSGMLYTTCGMAMFDLLHLHLVYLVFITGWHSIDCAWHAAKSLSSGLMLCDGLVQEWDQCKGSKPGRRGYTCGLWQLLHSLAAESLPAETGGAFWMTAVRCCFVASACIVRSCRDAALYFEHTDTLLLTCSCVVWLLLLCVCKLCCSVLSSTVVAPSA